MKPIKALLPTVTFVLLYFTLMGCDNAPVPAGETTGFVRCATQTPGEFTPQSAIRPSIPDYPAAQNTEVIKNNAAASSLETPVADSSNGFLEHTLKITRFATTDDPQEILDFYVENLSKAGWITAGDKPTASKLTFAYSVASTVAAARKSNPCAPTVEAGLPGYSVEVTIIRTSGNMTTVEIKEIVAVGY